MVRPSKLPDTETDYLDEQFDRFRQSSATDKEKVVEECAKHILALRQLDPKDAMYFELGCQKVRNWFNNKAQTLKKGNGRLPFKITTWNGERVFEAQKRSEIRNTLRAQAGQEPDASPAEDDHAQGSHLVGWNDMRRKMWKALSDSERDEYKETADEWNIDGPESHLKPILANRRALGWLRNMSSLLLQQCGMVVTIYGGFVDVNGEVMGMRYDTSDLLAERAPKDAPKVLKFTDNPEWDHELRKNFWAYFKPWIAGNPDSDETNNTNNAPEQSRARHVRSTFEFEFYDDGTPILVDTEDDEALKYLRRIDVLRQYLRLHYSCARGVATRSVPWGLLHSKPHEFFDSGMLPDDFPIQEPSKLLESQMLVLFKHIFDMETGPDGERHSAFRFSHYVVGKVPNERYITAVYDGRRPAPLLHLVRRLRSLSPILMRSLVLAAPPRPRKA
ncbi:hypothetical protein C8Q80DRAFT_1125329 [Daedaleopsis nitida]|nr:hypothetical protein C8Q80DRAFT_1125329 [Daedaleopsis nitida]